MAEPVLLIDTDVFVLLAASGLLGEVAALFGVAPGNLRRLYAVPSQLERGRKFKKNYSPEVLQAALAECPKVQALDLAPRTDLLEQMTGANAVTGIDDGEQVLFALTAEHPFIFLTSGDKTSMRALAGAAHLTPLKQQMCGRVACLEVILRALIEKFGVVDIAARMAPCTQTHRTLQVVFSEVNSKDQAQCLAAIAQYDKEMIDLLGNEFFVALPAGGPASA